MFDGIVKWRQPRLGIVAEPGLRSNQASCLELVDKRRGVDSPAAWVFLKVVFDLG